MFNQTKPVQVQLSSRPGVRPGKRVSRSERFSFESLFIGIAGADPELVFRCPTEKRKFITLGVLIVMTSLWAALTGGYAIWTVTTSYLVAWYIGLFWGLLIFNMERALVASLRSSQQWWKTALVAVPRLLLAVTISLAVSEPTVVMIFSSEIRAELDRQAADAARDAVSRTKPTQELDRLKTEIAQLEQEISAQTQKRDEAHRAAIGEAEGVAGSGIAGAGPVYHQKWDEFRSQEQSLKEVSARNRTQIEKKRREMEELENKAREWADQFTTSKFAATGLMARTEALHSLMSEHLVLRQARWLLTLMFLFVELLPLLIKLTSLGGAYERLIQLVEEQAERRVRQELLFHERLDQEIFKLDISQQEQDLAFASALAGTLSWYQKSRF